MTNYEIIKQNTPYLYNADTNMFYKSNDNNEILYFTNTDKPKRFIRQEFKYLSRKRK